MSNISSFRQIKNDVGRIDKLEEKLDLLKSYLVEKPNNFKILKTLADVYNEAGYDKEAEKIFKRFIKYEGAIRSIGYIELGRIYRKRYDYDKAIYYLNEVKDGDDIIATSYMELAKIMISKKEYEMARNYLNDADMLIMNYEVDPKRRRDLDSENYYLYAILAYHESDYITALEYSDKAISTNIDNFNFAIRYQLNKVDIEKEKSAIKESYDKKQLINYSKRTTLVHIKKQLNEQTGIDYNSLYTYCNNYIKEIEPISSILNDSYVVYYPQGIRLDDKVYYNIEVITHINSKNILHIYPFKYDFNHQVKNNYHSSSCNKRLSQTDKFMRRLQKGKNING